MFVWHLLYTFIGLNDAVKNSIFYWEDELFSGHVVRYKTCILNNTIKNVIGERFLIMAKLDT